MTPIPVGYIISSGHSGSTLTDLLLGAHPEVEGLGEIKVLAELHGRKGGGRCTCSATLEACPIWSKVLTRTASAGLSPADNDPKSPRFRKFNELMFRAIQEATGARALIDSSKNLSRFKAMRDSGKVRPILVHLIRDGRAVAWSNVRKGRPFAESLEDWARKQQTVAAYCQEELGAADWVRLRYEDIVGDPGAALAPVFGPLGVAQGQDMSGWAARTKHNLGGNRMRKSADGTIRLDTEYLTAIPDADWNAVGPDVREVLETFGYTPARDRLP